MSSQQDSSSHSHSHSPSSPSQAYFATPNINSTSTSSATENWMVATIIDDNDLMFGGKSLSAWYEEDRCRQSGATSSSKVEQPERRGRSRERHSQRHHYHGQNVGAGKP